MQGTAETEPFSQEKFDQLLALARRRHRRARRSCRSSTVAVSHDGATLERGDRLVIATHNEGKVRELAELFAPLGIETVSAGALGLPEPEETGESFAENAKVKARGRGGGLRHAGARRQFGAGGRGARRRARHPLGAVGRPEQGFRVLPWSASIASSRLAARPTGRANFVCALAFAWPRRRDAECSQAKVDGTLVWPPRGTRGFGYDPIFVPDGYDRDLRRDGRRTLE